MKNLFEELNMGDVIVVTMTDPSIDSGQSIETAVLGKFLRSGSLSLIVDLSGVCFCMADSEGCNYLEFKGRVQIISILNGGFKIVGYVLEDSDTSFGEWLVSVSKKRAV